MIIKSNIIAQTSIIKILNLLVGILVLALTARYYGPAGRGIIAAGAAIMALFGRFGGMSVGRVLLYLINNSHLTTKQFFKKNLLDILLLFLLLLIPAYIALFLLYTLIPTFFGAIHGYLLLLFSISLPFYTWAAYDSYIFSAYNDLTGQNILILSNRILYLLIFVAALFWLHISLHSFILLQSIVNLSLVFAEILYLIVKIRPDAIIDFKFCLQHLWAGIKVHSDMIGEYLILFSNIMVLNYYMTPKIVGYYQLASQLLLVMMIIPAVVQLKIISDITEIGITKAWHKQKKYIFTTTGVMGAAGISAWILAPYIIPFAMGAKFIHSVPLFRWLVPCLIANIFTVLLWPYWVAQGYLKVMSAISLFIAFSGLALSLYLVPKIGVMGAVYAMLLNFSLSLLVNIAFYKFTDSKIKKQRNN